MKKLTNADKAALHDKTQKYVEGMEAEITKLKKRLSQKSAECSELRPAQDKLLAKWEKSFTNKLAAMAEIMAFQKHQLQVYDEAWAQLREDVEGSTILGADGKPMTITPPDIEAEVIPPLKVVQDEAVPPDEG